MFDFLDLMCYTLIQIRVFVKLKNKKMKTVKKFFTLLVVIAVAALFCGLIIPFMSPSDEEVRTANCLVTLALIVLSLMGIIFSVFFITMTVLKNPERTYPANLFAIFAFAVIVSFLFTFGFSIFSERNVYFSYTIYEEILDVIKKIPSLAMFWYSLGLSVIIVFGSILFTKKPRYVLNEV